VEPAETYSTKSTGASPQRIRSPMLEHFDVLLSQLPHLASARADPSGPKTAIKSWSVAPHLVPLITSQKDDQGRPLFHDIQERDFLMPIGVWPTGELDASTLCIISLTSMMQILANGPLEL
jgi:hypothetical protein